MAKVKLTDGDGELLGSAHPPKTSTTQGKLTSRIGVGFAKDAVNIEDCGASQVAMVCNQNTRVGTLSGRTYLFPADKAVFVHVKDERDCAKHGAKVLDAVAIAAMEQAAADAAELAEYRAKAAKEKEEAEAAQAELEAKAAEAEKTAAPKAAESEKTAAPKAAESEKTAASKAAEAEKTAAPKAAK